MVRKDLMGEVDRLVVKIGTSSITAGTDSISSELMDDIARQVKSLKDEGKEVLIVTSGAIGVGLKTIGMNPNPNDIPAKQAAASVGQSILMSKWNESFDKQGLVVAQILITMDDYSVRETAINLNNTIDSLLLNNVIPIFNENDAVCIKEIGHVFGDNDTLSAMIASRTDSDLLIILSDVNGLYNKNPKLHEDAEFIPLVSDITSYIENIAGDPVTNVGVGGMKTKIKAATMCKDAGCRMIIAAGTTKNILTRVMDGEELGTLFTADTVMSKKRRWLKAACANGSIEVDEGAVKALRDHQSLLPIGVKSVTGVFDKGEVVDIACNGEVIAKGIPNYNSEEVSKIRGIHSDRIAEVLGNRSHSDVMQSNNIVILTK